MEFIDLAAQQQRIRNKIESNIAAVLNHGKYIMGPEVKQLEDRLAEFVGVSHAIGCASGTDALLLALMACQVGPGDAVFTSPFTFIATAEVISLLGATPVFVDIDPQSYNIDPAKLDLAIQAVKQNDASIHPTPAPYTQSSVPRRSPSEDGSSVLNPKGIVAVDLFGLPADYEKIEKIAERQKLFVIEDAAQSFGGALHGKKACAFGNIACTSFFPAKPLGCYGDGGMCFTDDNSAAEIMRSVRIHGKGQDKYDNVRIGINGRLDTLQAAILLAKFDIFAEEINLRQTVANRYTSLLQSNADVLPPAIPSTYLSAWAQYSILAKDGEHRAALQKNLNEAGIPSAIYYQKPLHLQAAFAYLGYKTGDFAVSEEYADRIFSIPMHPYLSEDEQQKIVKPLHV